MIYTFEAELTPEYWDLRQKVLGGINAIGPSVLSPEEFVLTARDSSGKLIGATHGIHQGNLIYIKFTGILPGARSQGIARAFVSEMDKAFPEKGRWGIVSLDFPLEKAKSLGWTPTDIQRHGGLVVTRNVTDTSNI